MRCSGRFRGEVIADGAPIAVKNLVNFTTNLLTNLLANLYESQMILVRFAGAMLHSRHVGMKHALP